MWLAKTPAPLPFNRSFDVDVSQLNPTTVVVSRDPDGRWYVTLALDTDDPAPLDTAGHEIGVARQLARKARNLARYQRRLARCQRGSANRRKAKTKLARAHRKIRDARADFLHRTNCGWGEFRRQLEYKAHRAGRTLVVIDRWYPSSKTCSTCGHLLAELSLSTRAGTCPGCRTRHDRDINAAKNILAAGRAVARTPGDACGADVRRQGSSLPRSAVKQEPQPVRVGIPVLQSGV